MFLASLNNTANDLYLVVSNSMVHRPTLEGDDWFYIADGKPIRGRKKRHVIFNKLKQRLLFTQTDNDLLQTAIHLRNTGTHISFIDTAGSGYHEEQGSDGSSLQNEGELRIVQLLIQTQMLQPSKTAVISPYSGQVLAAKEVLPQGMRISTIDSFQGQEQETVIISLVRSNDDGDIGFLKDYRRTNVAITRAKEQLFIIGDSATIAADPFYHALLTYIEQQGSYRTVWEFEL